MSPFMSVPLYAAAFDALAYGIARHAQPVCCFRYGYPVHHSVPTCRRQCPPVSATLSVSVADVSGQQPKPS
jgi:hypothetical protein